MAFYLGKLPCDDPIFRRRTYALRKAGAKGSATTTESILVSGKQQLSTPWILQLPLSDPWHDGRIRRQEMVYRGSWRFPEPGTGYGGIIWLSRVPQRKALPDQYWTIWLLVSLSQRIVTASQKRRVLKPSPYNYPASRAYTSWSRKAP